MDIWTQNDWIRSKSWQSLSPVAHEAPRDHTPLAQPSGVMATCRPSRSHKLGACCIRGGCSCCFIKTIQVAEKGPYGRNLWFELFNSLGNFLLLLRRNEDMAVQPPHYPLPHTCCRSNYHQGASRVPLKMGCCNHPFNSATTLCG